MRKDIIREVMKKVERGELEWVDMSDEDGDFYTYRPVE
jgi:hypothetical protein